MKFEKKQINSKGLDRFSINLPTPYEATITVETSNQQIKIILDRKELKKIKDLFKNL